MLNFVINLRLTANTCGIDKGEFAVFVFELRINCIARCARNVGNDKTFFANQTVDDRRLARIRLADNGYLNAVVLLHSVLPIVKITQTSVKKVTRAASVNGRNANGVFLKAKFVEFVEFHRQSANAVALVDAGNDRLTALFQHNGNVAVIGSETRANVTHKDDNVGGVDCHLRLLTHLLQY